MALVAAAGCAAGQQDNDSGGSDAGGSGAGDSGAAGSHPGGPPSVRLEVEPDSESGWNVHLATENFEFAPAQVGEQAVDGEGHAHLYLDDEKVARVYGPWFHLDPALVPEGERTLSVQLNGNDHAGLETSAGEPIEDSTTITSDGSGGQDHEHGSGASSDVGLGADVAADVETEITLKDGQVTPPPGRVEAEQGQIVRLRVSSDVEDTVHVHGFDLEAAIRPGEPAVITFEADQSGVFEVETHDDPLILTQLQVR